MAWALDHVLLPSHDTAVTGGFLEEILDMRPVAVEQASDGTNPMGPEHFLRYVDEGGREVHVVRPVPDFARRNGIAINPTLGHVAFAVDDLDSVEARMRERGWLAEAAGRIGPDGRARVYLYDPFMNVIEVNR